MKIERALFHYGERRIEELKETGRRLAHYTSAETAVKIIDKKCVWMRSSVFMNDASEVRWGISLWRNALVKCDIDQALTIEIDRLSPGSSKAFKAWDFWEQILSADTYVTSLCEFESGGNDNGTLSMWREYGGKCGTALVFEWDHFNGTGHNQSVSLSPVAYFNQVQFEAQLRALIGHLKKVDSPIDDSTAEYNRRRLYGFLRMSIMSLKHPCFHEEREWRCITNPIFDGEAQKDGVEIVNGLPQMVQMIDLSPLDNEKRSLLENILMEVVIGPCSHPFELKLALQRVLKDAGVSKYEELVRDTGIPLRT